jgi:hypothetical protein
VTPGALLKFNRVSLPVPEHALRSRHDASKWKHQGDRNGGLTTHSIVKMLADLRTEKQRIEEAISVFERLANGRAGRHKKVTARTAALTGNNEGS